MYTTSEKQQFVESYLADQGTLPKVSSAAILQLFMYLPALHLLLHLRQHPRNPCHHIHPLPPRLAIRSTTGRAS
jgi:hypothetical protein